MKWIICLFLSLTARADLETMKARVPHVVDLKDQGLIGEQPDGYLGVVKAGNAAAKKIVDEENQDRQNEYRSRAKTQDETPEVVSQVLGQARIRQEKSGRFVRTEKGDWIKK